MDLLHVSDLHFGTEADARTWSGQLSEDLANGLGCKRLDALILSGDIATRSCMLNSYMKLMKIGKKKSGTLSILNCVKKIISCLLLVVHHGIIKRNALNWGSLVENLLIPGIAILDFVAPESIAPCHLNHFMLGRLCEWLSEPLITLMPRMNQDDPPTSASSCPS